MKKKVFRERYAEETIQEEIIPVKETKKEKKTTKGRKKNDKSDK